MASHPAEKLPTPDTAELSGDNILSEMLEQLHLFFSDFPKIDFDILTSLLSSVRAHTANDEDTVRSFLKTFQHTSTYRNAVQNVDTGVREKIDAFIKGQSAEEVVAKGGFEVRGAPSPGVKHHFRLLDFVKTLVSCGRGKKADVVQKELEAKGLPIIYEDNGAKKIMEVFANSPFENWGLSVKNTPKYTFVPTTVLGVQNLVRWAKAKDLRVRCAGYRHSWSDTFSNDGEVLISLLNLHQVTTIPDVTPLFDASVANAGNELKTMELGEMTPGGKRLARIGVSVTNEDLRRWLVTNDAWALPVDVILVEVTIGGVNAPICHGAGRRNMTVSDFVRRIEYVDVNGNLQDITDPTELGAAAGAFGLLGVVTHITFELDAMTYALMKPLKPDICLAIPPLSTDDIPPALKGNFNQKDYTSALSDFESRAANDYYCEWFWFTYQQQAWVNTWNATTDRTGFRDYPSTPQVWIQWLEGWIGGVIIGSDFFQAMPGRWQAQILATLGMAALPPQFFGIKDAEIKTQLTNGLHFRRGIQNSRVRDMEYQIPIPGKRDDPTKPDFDVVRKAWWDVINLVYSDVETAMRLTLELRIMGGSNMIMAAQRGNTHGTASIEVLSIPDAVADSEWEPFLQKVSDKWMALTDGHGQPLNVRPHWAKEWQQVKLKGMPARKYLKTVAYKNEREEFKQVLKKIGEKQGWSLEELQRRFSNELWDDVIYSA